MIYRLASSVNDGSKFDPINVKNSGRDNKINEKKVRFIRWIVWASVLAGLIALFVFMFSPSGATVPVKKYELVTESGELKVKFTTTEEKGSIYTIDNSYSGSFVNLGDRDFVYVVKTTNGRYVRLSGLVISGTSDVKEGNSTDGTGGNDNSKLIKVTYPVYMFTTTSGPELLFYDAPNKMIAVGDDKHSLSIPSVASWKWLGGFNKSLQLPDPSKSVLINLFSSFGTLFLLFLLFYFFALRRMRGIDGSGDSLFAIGKSLAKLAKTKVKFSDVAGIIEEKQELIEVVDYLKHPGKYVVMGARIPRGVILYGPPGTGKTLLAKAVAGEAQVPFFQIAGSTFEDMFVGVGAKRVRDLFSKAKKAAPCIIFIDEIDSVGGKRGRSEIIGGNYAVSEQTINQLLGEMDGFETKTGIVVIAATNRIDVLDEALLRPGRFDRHIKISLPDVREREEILRLHAKNKNLSSKISFSDIARRTPGFSGAQLESTLNEAVLLAVRNNRTVVLESDVDEAIDRVIAGPAKVSRTMTERERVQIAYHEAGHALTGLHLNEGEEIQKITIIPRGNAGGYTLSAPKGYETNLKRKTELLNTVAVFMGGRASEEIIYGKDNISSGASDDLFKATNIVRSMVMQLGMSSLGKTQYVPSQGTLNPNSVKLYSDETALAIDKEINKIIEHEYQRAVEIITNNLDELKLIVEALLTVETIVKRDIEFIHKNKKLPEEILLAKQKSANVDSTDNDENIAKKE